jgi:protein CrcB
VDEEPAIMNQVLFYFVVAFSGTCGVMLRFFTNYWQTELHGIILSTFIVNCIGSFFIGLFWELKEKKKIGEQVHIILSGGFLGGLSTFSGYAFNLLILATNNANSRKTKQDTSLYPMYQNIITLILYGALTPFFGMALAFLGVLSIR